MTSELKPCPFCGGEAEIINDCGQFYAECANSACVSKPTTVLDDVIETVIEDWNTRATPAADTLTGLARYESWNIDDDFGIRPSTNGEYVLYSEAAAVVEKLTCPKYLEEKLNQIGLVDKEWQKRAEAAEAELAQIKAQEPVAWMHPEARWTDVSKQEVAVHCKVGTYPLPLYDAPVSDSLKAECDRYKEALGLCQRTLAMIIDPKSIVSTTSIIAFASATESEAKARAALNVEDRNDTR